MIGQTVAMDREGRQELRYRALEGDVPGIRDRLTAGDDIAGADRQGFKALHFAAQQSQTAAVRALLEAGAPVDPQDPFGKHTAMACSLRLARAGRDRATAPPGWR